MFDLVVMVDWSAANQPGPARPAADNIWLAWGTPDQPPDRRPEPEYLRTRQAAETRTVELLRACPDRALVGFDFPFGYPHGSGLGGGRGVAALLAALITDGEDNRNDRFAVASRLNALMRQGPGPFWGCPPRAAGPTLTPTKPSFDGLPYGEYRIVDGRHRSRGIQSVWKLYTTGSVGSQALTGLARLHRLLTVPDLAQRSRVWPFETGWDATLEGIVYAEVWPSLTDHAAQDHPIKDARQVMAARDWALDQDAAGGLRARLARPPDLDPAQERICRHYEGWILGPVLINRMGVVCGKMPGD